MMLRDPLGSALTDGPASGRPHGMHIPFLPTIATAVVVAALSFLCQETAVAPAPVGAAQAVIDAASFAGGRMALSAPVAPRPPATLAFAELYPLAFEASEPKVATRSVPHFAVLPPRRPCLDPRCAETAAIPRRASPFAAARPSEASLAEADRGETPPIEVGQSDGPSFPGIALPFAPVARVVGEATGMMRSGASALGSSAMMLVDRLR